MRITERKLRRIIREEAKGLMNEDRQMYSKYTGGAEPVDLNRREAQLIRRMGGGIETKGGDVVYGHIGQDTINKMVRNGRAYSYVYTSGSIGSKERAIGTDQDLEELEALIDRFYGA